MVAGSASRTLRSPGRIVIGPTNLSAAYPYGGTEIGRAKTVVLTSIGQSFRVSCEGLGGEPSDVLGSPSYYVFSCFLRGWDDVLQSWTGIFRGPGHSQFILTNESISTKGDTAWVTLDENLVDLNGAGTIAATNLYIRDHEGAWKLVAHHGSPVMSR